MAVFWVVAPCSLVEVYQRFSGPCCLHHQGYEYPQILQYNVNPVCDKCYGYADIQETSVYFYDAFVQMFVISNIVQRRGRKVTA
jgi:hypothetical protein